MIKKIVFVLLSLTAIASLCPAAKTADQELRQREVTVATQVWTYPRIYPLLDGLFQDIAATQVSSTPLNANSANGTSVDALQQSFQLQIQANQLAGVQNAAAAQTISANAGYQNQLVQQETQLLQALITAQGQQGQAQSKLDTLSSSTTASAADLTAAKLAQTTASDVVNSITAQLAAVKSAIAVPTAIGGSSNTMTNAPSAPASLPSSLSTLPGGPSFPATKQLDNQIGLLWDRVSRLVGAMTWPDSMNQDNNNLYLVKFDTGIYPFDRKRQLLDVTYSATCETGGPAPTVVDLFPRNAALNITNTKYKDTSFSISGLLSFLSFGVSAGYNREHLKLSQMLGESSYITGHGIGESDFGWLFGISLGDEAIAPGPRSTFVLLNVPNGCTAPHLTVASAKWSKPPDSTSDKLRAKQLFPPLTPTKCDSCVTSIDFNRVEYDPAAGKAASVMVTIGLSHDMDQQQTVSVNGVYIKRARDTFGRGTSTSGSGGLLETGSLDSNTWIPAGPQTLIANLDGTVFGERFPKILLSSPKGVIDVNQDRSNGAKITISGLPLQCDHLADKNCKPELPSLAYKKAVVTRLGVARWMETRKVARIDKLCITVVDNAPPAAGTAPTGVPSIQVVSDSEDPVWSGNTEVSVIDKDKTTRLTCDPPRDSRLLCDAPDSNITTGTRQSLLLQVIDLNHSNGSGTGPIKGFVSTLECEIDGHDGKACRQPLIWKTNPPELNVKQKKWDMGVEFVNVDPNDQVSLGPLKAVCIECKSGNKPCSASFPIELKDLANVSNLMEVQIKDADNKDLESPGSIVNFLANVSPLITSINDKKTEWSGRNLIFDKMRVGDSGSVYPIACPDGKECRLPKSYGPKDTGYLYFLYGSQAFLFVQMSTTGVMSDVFLDLPVPSAKGKASDTASAAAAKVTPAALQQPLMFRSESIKKLFPMLSVK